VQLYGISKRSIK
jgi:hypothetical protein